MKWVFFGILLLLLFVLGYSAFNAKNWKLSPMLSSGDLDIASLPGTVQNFLGVKPGKSLSFS